MRSGPTHNRLFVPFDGPHVRLVDQTRARSAGPGPLLRVLSFPGSAADEGGAEGIVSAAADAARVSPLGHSPPPRQRPSLLG